MNSGTSDRQRSQERSRSAQSLEMSFGGLECSLVSLRPPSNATTPDYRILVKRDRTKANYAVTERCCSEGFNEQS